MTASASVETVYEFRTPVAADGPAEASAPVRRAPRGRIVSTVFREVERQERRVLGAIEFVDATTGARVDAPLVLAPAGTTAAGAPPRLVRNHVGLTVLQQWPLLAAHDEAFLAPPSAPAVGTLQLDFTVADPAGDYLPRAFSMPLPRDPDPANRGNADSLFTPQRVELMRAARAPLGANWSRLDVRVADAASGDGLGGALVEVREAAAGALLARGMTDWRGEAVLPVAGVPITTWSSDPGAVVATEIAVRLRAFFVPAVGVRTTQAAADAGRPPSLLPAPDPDRLATDPAVRVSDPAELAIAAGGARAVRLAVALA